MLYINPLEASAQQGITLDQGAKNELAFKELEQVFAFMLLQEMRKSVPEDTLIDEGQTGDLYKQFMDDSIAKEWAESGQLGIAAQMQAQLDQTNRAHVAQGEMILKKSLGIADDSFIRKPAH